MRIVNRTAVLALFVAGLTQAHDDLVGTRYVAPSGVNQGSCESRDRPCRTLSYAMAVAHQGDAIKIGGGIYDLSGIDLDTLLFGKQGLRGGYAREDRFHVQDPLAHPTKIIGADPRYVQTLLAHGFTPIDANGQPMQRVHVDSQPPASCVAGLAGQFPCWNIDFLAQIPLTGFSSQPLSAANVWGFVHHCDAGNREYAVIGLEDGTAIVDVTEPTTPVEVGFVDGVSSGWREVKILQVESGAPGCDRAYAYLSTEGPGGLQILDLSNLPGSVSVANTLTEYSTSHTLYISNVDYASNKALPGRTPYLYVAGSNLENGRYRIYDLANPTSPQRVTVNPGIAGLADPRGFYMHDSTTVLITDERTSQCAGGANPCEVLVDFNEQSVDLWNVTNKAQPQFLSRTSFPNARYIHSGWPTPDLRYVIVHDELDELQIPGLRTSIYTLDIADLRAPVIVTSYTGPGTTTDHNGYSLADRYYVSHYKRGLVIFDLADPNALREVAAFDTFLLPCENTAGTEGAWGVYPFLPSGTLLVSDIDNGLFMLRRNETSTSAPQPPTCAPPPQAPPPSFGGNGGGGALGWWVLGVLGFRLCAAARSRHARASAGAGSTQRSHRWRAASAVPAPR
jgi:choice-of-anchor B domain-containing protein